MKLRSAEFQQESRRLIKVALPILLAQIASSGMGVVDTFMASMIGVTDLAAIGLGAGIWFPVFILCAFGFLAFSPLVSHALEKRQHQALRDYFFQGPILAIPLSLLGMLILMNPEFILNYMQLEQSLYQLTYDYLIYIAYGIPAITLYFALRFYWEGFGNTLPTMWISWFGFLVNIPLNALFMFGGLGIEAYGAAGAGLASALSMWLMLIVAVLYSVKSSWYQAYIHQAVLSDFRPQKVVLLKITKIGVPIALAILFEVSLFTSIALFLGPFGEDVIAGHQIAMSFTSILFMVPLSLAFAVSITVGRAFGSNDPQQIKVAILTGLYFALVIGVFISVLTYVVRFWVVAQYTQSPSVADIAVTLFLFAALYQVFDSIQVIVAGMLRGFHDSQVTMWVTLFSYWVVGLGIGISFGYYDWFSEEPLGVYAFWAGIDIGLFIAAILLSWRLWNRYQVIFARLEGGRVYD